MLTIRFQRTGTKNRAEFRVVLAQSYRSASKKFLEVLGHYNPRTKNFGIKDESRLKYWISKNVAISPSVRNLFVEKKLVDGKKVKAWQPKKKEASEQSATPAPAAAAPAVEAAPAPEVPVTETPPAV